MEKGKFSLDLSLLMEMFENETSFEIIMLLITYRELSLTQLTDKIGKSKPTIHRYLQRLQKSDIVKETREKKVRGNIYAKYYSANIKKLQELPYISQEEYTKLNSEQKIEVYKVVIEFLKPTISFLKNSLEKLHSFLDNLASATNETIQQFMAPQDLHLTMNFFNEVQYQKYLQLLIDFKQKMLKMLVEEEKKNPGATKPYLVFDSIIPFKKILEG